MQIKPDNRPHGRQPTARRLLAAALALMAVLTLLIWGVARFVQPALPASVDSTLLPLAASLLGVAAVLSGVKDTVGLIHNLLLSPSDSSGTHDQRYKQLYQLQTERLVDDLHELINWHQFGVVVPLETMAYHVAHGKLDVVPDLLARILEHAHSTVNELRALHVETLSKGMDHEYLYDSLQALASIWSGRIGLEEPHIRVRVECDRHIILPPWLSQPVLRVAGLALMNAILHSGITTDPSIVIRIQVEKTAQQLILKVSDDGGGMNQVVEGYGIGRMRDLVAGLVRTGTLAHLTVESKAGKGTAVILRTSLETSDPEQFVVR